MEAQGLTIVGVYAPLAHLGGVIVRLASGRCVVITAKCSHCLQQWNGCKCEVNA